MSALLGLLGALRAGGAVTDATFDQLYPRAIADLGTSHWTPVAVALRAARLLAPDPGARVLDLGSGPGKLCIVGALATGASFTGIEQRAHLVRAAIVAADRAGARTARFIHGDVLDVDWRPYDAYYLFNPFGEHIGGAIDATAVVDPFFYRHYAEAVTRRLGLARPGTRVVTYHGFGGAMPDGYHLAGVERAGSDELELWVRGAARGRPAG